MPRERLYLPSSEVAHLILMPPKSQSLKIRLYLLHQAGWPLSTLGQSLTPPRSKATLYNWTSHTPDPNSIEYLLATARSIPLPPEKSDSPQNHRPLTPKPNPEQTEELAYLAPLARQHRSNTPQNSIYRTSNERLTELATSLYLKGVPVHDIAKAANVSDRAMYRRVQKGIGNAN